MFHLDGFNLKLSLGITERGAFVPAKFRKLFKARSRQQITGSLGSDRKCGGSQAAKSWQIHVIHMGVRQKQDINRREFLHGQGRGHTNRLGPIVPNPSEMPM